MNADNYPIKLEANNFDFDLKETKEKIFPFDLDFPLQKNSNPHPLIPEIDQDYSFNEEVTKAILSAFLFNKKLLLHGLYGSGKSTHIEQVAARLGWPLLRINLDGNITRMDLIGRDHLIVENNKQITKFKEGMLPFAFTKPIALLLDEYDAGRAEIMFVIQRMLEENSFFTVLDQNIILKPHKYFRVFATANTLGFGDQSGKFAGTNIINHAQLDRWQIIAKLDYLDFETEKNLILKKFPNINDVQADLDGQIISLANLIRNEFKNDKLSFTFSPRKALSFCENILIFKNIKTAFDYSYLNLCDEDEKDLAIELYYHVFEK